MIEIIPVEGLPEVGEGDDLGALIAGAMTLEPGDVVVIAQKVVSKAEGRLVEIDPEDRDARRALVEGESMRVLRRRGDLVISETHHGFVCANAGVDFSNVDDGWAALLPLDADRSARHVRDALAARVGVNVAVIVSDTFGRAWRLGLTDVAIGVAGLAAVVDLRGQPDGNGRELQVTEVAIADEVAGAAELVMGKASRVPAAIVRGLDPAWRRDASARELVRAARDDLFR